MVLVTQIAQQICGISPVVYFSTSILRKVFKANAAFLALGILFVKFPASLCTIPVLPVSLMTFITFYSLPSVQSKMNQ